MYRRCAAYAGMRKSATLQGESWRYVYARIAISGVYRGMDARRTGAWEVRTSPIEEVRRIVTVAPPSARSSRTSATAAAAAPARRTLNASDDIVPTATAARPAAAPTITREAVQTTQRTCGCPNSAKSPTPPTAIAASGPKTTAAKIIGRDEIDSCVVELTRTPL